MLLSYKKFINVYLWCGKVKQDYKTLPAPAGARYYEYKYTVTEILNAFIETM